MQLTKYEHACFTVEKDGQLLVVDPGNFTTDFIAPEHVVGIVITHSHQEIHSPFLVAAALIRLPCRLPHRGSKLARSLRFSRR
jgi:L-ascorbate metabolism protein UlaG (beta-lactamase superfamily)